MRSVCGARITFVARERASFSPETRGREHLKAAAVEGRPDVINPAGVLQINSVRVYWTLAIMYHPASDI